MKIRLSSVEVQDLGPFVGKHLLELPESGMLLVRGQVGESGGGSGAGKSFLLNSIPFVTGSCPFPATELQSWYTEAAPSAQLTFRKGAEEVIARRSSGLSFGRAGEKPTRGKPAAAEMEKFFGMDPDTLALATYRPQGEPGAFLNKDGPGKMAFLSRLLGATQAEEVADASGKKGRQLSEAAKTAREFLSKAERTLQDAQRALGEAIVPPVASEAIRTEIASLEASREADKTPKIDAAIEEEKARLQAAANDESRETRAELSRLADELSAVMLAPDAPGVANLRAKWRAAEQDVAAAEEEDRQAAEAERAWKRDIDRQATAALLVAAGRDALEKKLRTLTSNLTVLRQSVCPTCVRSWESDSCEQKKREIQTEIRDAEEALAETGLAQTRARDLQAQKWERPTPSRTAEMKGRREVAAFVHGEATDGERLRRDATIAALNAQVAAMQARATAQEAQWLGSPKLTKLAAAKAAQRAIIQRAGTRLAELRPQLESAIRAELARAAAQDRVSRAQVDRDAQQVALDAVVKEAALELDSAELLKRFLGAAVEDVLAEMSHVASSILGRVENTQHVSIRLTVPEGTNRVEPEIFVRGRSVPFRSGISGGMKTPVYLGVDLAIGEVVSKRRGAYPGWLVLDEALNGLGAVEKKSCLEMLQDYASDRLVLVVDHDLTFQGMFHEVISVEQANGLSSLRHVG